MKCTVTLTMSEWWDLINILIAQKVQAEREAADPYLECIKSFSESDAATAKNMIAILLERRQIVYEEEEA